MNFKDHFSSVAEHYATYRPRPSEELGQYLASLTSTHQLAWDCATGNGQVAQILVPFFEQVIATDASADQIAQAIPHEQIQYRVALAENSGLPDHCVDLITVSAAIHWFDHDRFYPEVRRVLKPTGTIAVWSYSRFEQPDNAVGDLAGVFEECLRQVYPYSTPEALTVLDNYRTIPFPFYELPASPLYMEAEWRVDQVIGWIGSLSPVIAWVQQEGPEPVERLYQQLRQVWGSQETYRLRWPLCMRVGRLSEGD